MCNPVKLAFDSMMSASELDSRIQKISSLVHNSPVDNWTRLGRMEGNESRVELMFVEIEDGDDYASRYFLQVEGYCYDKTTILPIAEYEERYQLLPVDDRFRQDRVVERHFRSIKP